ncbi:hypothetical protein Tco_0922920 [Tanacetum coccineum]|uniref:Uncharacterized protein n=1 Tax=Tanacetum coccineum TaxID=301880 RepID=A0ABQ5CZL6_9ASTR
MVCTTNATRSFVRCFDSGKLLSAKKMHKCQSGKNTRLSEDVLSNVPHDTKDKDGLLMNSFFETRDDFLSKRTSEAKSDDVETGLLDALFMPPRCRTIDAPTQGLLKPLELLGMILEAGECIKIKLMPEVIGWTAVRARALAERGNLLQVKKTGPSGDGRTSLKMKPSAQLMDMYRSTKGICILK